LNRKTLLSLGLLIVFILSACTPATPAPETPPDAAPEVAPVENSQEEAPPAPEATVAEAPAAAPTETEAPVEEPVAVATARGNDLHATDPATVNIASGKPQLIEFFAFW
jgi:hypothetical protein